MADLDNLDQDEIVENDELVDDYEDQTEELDEATDAANSLKPGSKSEMLTTLVSKFAGMNKQDLSHYLTKTLDLIGKEARSIPNDAAAKNAATIKAKPSYAVGSVKEDVDDLFGEEELTEDFKNKASTLFEAAVQNRVLLEVARIEEEFEAQVARIEEEFEAQLEEQVLEVTQALEENVSEYIDYVVENWLEENEIAIERGIRSEATENFIVGLKNLFAESYVDVPEDKVDLVQELESYVAELEEDLNNAINENLELTGAFEDAVKESVFEDVTEDMTDTQAENFRKLTESVEYTDTESYAQKLSIIKEQFFKGDGGTKTTKTERGVLNEDSAVMNEGLDDETEAEEIPENMRGYLDALKRTSKN